MFGRRHAGLQLIYQSLATVSKIKPALVAAFSSTRSGRVVPAPLTRQMIGGTRSARLARSGTES